MLEEDSVWIFAGAAIAVTGAGLAALGARFRRVPGKTRGANIVFISGLVDAALGISLIFWRLLT